MIYDNPSVSITIEMNRKNSAKAGPASMDIVSILKSESSRKMSQSIPITNHIKRTESEKQLCEDKALAERRESRMYNRIVNGICQRQGNASRREVRSLDFLYENAAYIENIKRTRFQPAEDSESLHLRHEKTWNTPREHPTLNSAPWREHYSNGFLPSAVPVDDEEEMFILDF